MQYRFKSTVPTFSIIFSRYLGRCIRILYFFRIFSSTYQEKNEENLDYFRIFKQESSCKNHRTTCKTASRTISRTTLFKKFMGTDPFQQIIGEFRKCVNEMIKFLGFFSSSGFLVFDKNFRRCRHLVICSLTLESTHNMFIFKRFRANSVYCQHCSHWKHKVLGRLTALFHMDIDLRVIIALLLLLLLITKTRHTLQKMVKMLKQQIGFVV